jgi:hypothetical protein
VPGADAPGTGPFEPALEWPAHPRRLLIAEVVFDTMVPFFLACANRVQLLSEAFAGRAHIPDRVRGELSGLAGRDERALRLLLPAPFAQVHTLDRAGALRALTRQQAWHGVSVIEAEPSKDRGEAEAHELCAQNPGWVLVSQDANALNHGKIAKVPVFSAADALLVVTAQKLCLPGNAWKIYEMMIAGGMYPSRFWPDDAASEARFLKLAGKLGDLSV